METKLVRIAELAIILLQEELYFVNDDLEEPCA